MKMLLQHMCLDKLSWDEPLKAEINSRWCTIIRSLPLLKSFRIPRSVVCGIYVEFEVHISTDVSECAFGACIYIRSISD